MNKFLLILVLWTGATGYSYAQQIPAKIIPDFQFSRLDQTAFTNMDLARGKLLFFMFFDSDCDHCQLAMANIDQQYKSFAKAAVYFVSLDDKDKIRSFVDTYAKHLKDQKNVILLRDNQNQFISRFKPLRYPGMFLYSANNKLIDYEDNPETVFRIVHFIGVSANPKQD